VARKRITVTFECDPDAYFRFKAGCRANDVTVSDALEFLIHETNKHNRVSDLKVNPEKISGPGPMVRP